MAGCVHCGTARTAPGSTHPPGRNSDLASPSNQSTRPRTRHVIPAVGREWFECPTPQVGRNGVEGVGSTPGPRASLPAPSLHVPVVSPVWREAVGCVSFRAACSGWPDRRGWQAMGACGQGCPRTKVPRGPGTRCSLEAMGREVGQAFYGHRFRQGGFHPWSAGIRARIFFARPSSLSGLESGLRVRGLSVRQFGVA